MAKTHTNWLFLWKPFKWHSLKGQQITEKKRSIEKKVENYLTKTDLEAKKKYPQAKKHKIKFVWHKGIEDPFSYILAAYLSPPPTDGNGTFGARESVITPTPPPKP